MKALSRVALLIGALALAGTTACSKEPDQAQIHRDAANALLQDGKWNEAAQEYAKSLEADPKQEKMWERKAYCHMQAGALEDAEAALLKMLELKTEPAAKAEVYRNIAGMYMQKTVMDKAEKYFLEASKVDPKDAMSLQWLGEIYSQRGGARDMKAPAVPESLQKALDYYDKAIAINPNEPALYLNKRIVMGKYMEDARQKKVAAEQAAVDAGADKEKAEAAKAEAAQHQAKMDEFKKQFEEMTKKLVEVQKAAKK